MPAELIVLDTETSGLTPPIGVCELAWVRINAEMEVLDEHCVLVNPGRPIEPGAINVHGITDAEVANAVDLATAIAPLTGQPVIVIGHNIAFDLRIVGEYLDIKGEVCTLALSRQYLRGQENNKLTTVRDHLGLPAFDAHRALGDVHTSLNILRRILSDHSLTLAQVTKRQNKPRMLHLMPFGIHQGTPLVNVPSDYRRWLLEQRELDKDLEYSLRKLEDL